ncbi:hypothetical protein ACROYT_G002724 [Oculina patagonica]
MIIGCEGNKLPFDGKVFSGSKQSSSQATPNSSNNKIRHPELSCARRVPNKHEIRVCILCYFVFVYSFSRLPCCVQRLSRQVSQL